MNAKVLTVVVGLLMLVPAGYAASYQFGDCPNGYDCTQNPSGEPFPPDAVTGHTVYANFTLIRVADESLGLPTDFAAVAGYFAIAEVAEKAAQRECVVWFNGYNLDQRPPTTSSSFGFDDDDNSFPSDEDQAVPGDEAYQDYDFDRDVDNCLPRADGSDGPQPWGSFAVVVEKGDCSPEDAVANSFKFRGHLDFVDPNDIYHEVQEYEYQCTFAGPGQSLALGFGAPAQVSPIVASMFPETTPPSDPHNYDGCQAYDNPVNNQDLANNDTGHFDLGHKCNGSVRDLFTERLWITQMHDVVYDQTIQADYNFALQIDTCSGLNIYELPGKDANGAQNNYTGSTREPGLPYNTVSHTIDDTDATLDSFDLGLPLVEVCHDGSSFSFDDTSRGRTTHFGAPTDPGDEEIMRGNSYDFDPASETQGQHRTNCRANWIDWPYNEYPPGVRENCYDEDHKTAQIDIYVFDFDPTGLWNANANGLTGSSPYAGPGTATGPNDTPPY